MDMTYDKTIVLRAANLTAQAIRAERRALLAEWDARSVWYKFFQSALPEGNQRPESHRYGQQQIAERVSFKATFCYSDSIYLSDAEIDAIKDWWLIKELD
jgi:hypothetical protein